MPTIVAEALAEIHDPLETVLSPGPAAGAGEVVRAIARSLAPPEAAVAPPTWLWPAQVPSFRRAVAAIERHGGVLLADPIGSGKTFVALAVARALAGGRETVVVAPAVLRQQWQATAARLEVPIAVLTHEAVSRGSPENRAWPLVVVDESHRFRNPATRRYVHLAPFLVGRRVLLLSATPVVNRARDLVAQLLLGVRDDALAARGCPSLAETIAAGTVPPPLGDLVLCRPRPDTVPVPRAIHLTPPLSAAEHGFARAIERLALSPVHGVAALVRTVLLRSLASSPGALKATLDRYDQLLYQAGSAARCGRPVGRRAIRLFLGEEREQLAFWELLPRVEGPADLVLDDHEPLATLREAVREFARLPDAKCLALRGLLADGESTVVFTTSRDTLDWLRRQLADLRPAWVAGSGAGIGASRLARSDVLSWFGPNRTPRAPMPASTPPRLLFATDVAAEGLDLQRAGRVVHYDLPWTSVRLDQRGGRAVRLGSLRAEVDIVQFSPAPALEARLRQLERLALKRRLSTRAWSTEAGAWLYRWRAEIAEWAGSGSSPSAFAVITGAPAGWLFGLAIDRLTSDGARVEAPASLLWRGDDGVVREESENARQLLQRVASAGGRPPSGPERRRAIAVLAPLVRERLRAALGESWRRRRVDPELRAFRRRLTRLAGEAARRRDRRWLDLLDRTLGWACGGLTAGEAALLRACRGLHPRDLEPALERLLRRPREGWVPVPRLTGIVRITAESDSDPDGAGRC